MTMLTKGPMLKVICLVAVAFLLACSLSDTKESEPNISAKDLEGCFQNLHLPESECAVWCFDTNYTKYVYWKNGTGIIEQIQKYEIGREGKITAAGSYKDSEYPDSEIPSTEYFTVYLKEDTLFTRFEGSKRDFSKYAKVESTGTCGPPFTIMGKPNDWYLQ